MRMGKKRWLDKSVREGEHIKERIGVREKEVEEELKRESSTWKIQNDEGLKQRKEVDIFAEEEKEDKKEEKEKKLEQEKERKFRFMEGRGGRGREQCQFSPKRRRQEIDKKERLLEKISKTTYVAYESLKKKLAPAYNYKSLR